MGVLRIRCRTAAKLAVLLSSTCLTVPSARAQNATWLPAPATNVWNTNSNWTPATVPTGTATFGASTQTTIDFVQNSVATPTSVGTIAFTAAAPAYTFELNETNTAPNVFVPEVLNITGTGIVNNSAFAPSFSVIGNLGLATPAEVTTLNFRNASTAANATFFGAANTDGFSGFGFTNLDRRAGGVNFYNTSTAANAVMSNSGGGVFFHDASTAANVVITDFVGGEIHFLDTSSAANATITAGGIIGFFNSSTAANATIAISGRLAFFDSSSAANANISNDVGVVSFDQSSTAANATIVNSNNSFGAGCSTFFGTQFCGSSTAGNATITNNTGGITSFVASSSAGTAHITNNSGGRTNITSLATADTATIINNAGGIVDVSAFAAFSSQAVGIGSLSGAGNVFLGSRNLALGSLNGNDVIGGIIADGGQNGPSGETGGSLTKVGAGTLTLTGDQHLHGRDDHQCRYIEFGWLSHQRRHGEQRRHARRHGHGVRQYYGQQRRHALARQLHRSFQHQRQSRARRGQRLSRRGLADAADRTNVSGTATLGGTVHAIFGPGSYTSNSYTILSAAGGRIGTFNALTTSGLPATLSREFELHSDRRTARHAHFADRPTLPTLAGTTPNQKAVAAAQDTAFNSGRPNISALYNLSLAQLPAALDQLSGEVHPSTTAVLMDESLYARSAILGRLRQASYGGNAQMASLSMGGPQAFAADGGEAIESALAYAKSPIVTKAPMKAPSANSDIVFWAQGFGARGQFDSDGNATNVRRDLAGFFSGVDTRAGTNGRVGIAAGYTGSRNTLDGRGSSNVETGHLMGYGGWAFGELNLRAGGAYAWHSIDTSRAIVFPGFFDNATASYNGRTGQIFGEARLRLCVRQRCGRAVRGRRVGQPADRWRERTRRRCGAGARRQQVRGRLLDSRHTRGQHDPDRPRHGPGAARVRVVAARLRQRDAGRAARLHRGAGPVRDRGRADCA